MTLWGPPRRVFVAAVACALAACVVVAAPTTVNIHVKLSPSVDAAATAANAFVQAADPNNRVYLGATQVMQPHVTLFLTEFADGAVPGALETAVTALLPRLPGHCDISLGAPVASGAYGMWFAVSTSACMQLLSDTIVNGTQAIVSPDQPVPAWVQAMPDGPEKTKRIAYVAAYGSPNVFEFFAPHVTLAYDNTSAAGVLATVLDDAGVRPMVSAPVDVLGLGQVGPYGTVLRGLDWADYHIGRR